MPTELINGFGEIYLTIEFDAVNNWVYNNWIGRQTYVGIIAGADACLHPLRNHACAYLLNDNRQVIGPWDHAVEWLITSWAPRAISQGLTHFAHIISSEALAALSAEAMHIGINGQLQMRMFDDSDAAQEWLRQAQYSNRTR